MCAFTINLSKIPYPQTQRARIVGNFHDYTLNKGYLTLPTLSARTENINSCTAGIINAGKRNFVFHAAPEAQPLGTIKDILSRKIELLRSGCDDIKALICGGWELKNNDRESIRSFDLYNTIANILDDLGVKFSMICGKEKGAPLENLYVINQTGTLWSDTFKKGYDINSDRQKIIEQLEKNYQFVDIPEEQAIKVIDTFSASTQKLVK